MSQLGVTCLNAVFGKNCRIEADGSISLESLYSGYFNIESYPVRIPLAFVCFLELSLDQYRRAGSGPLQLRVIAEDRAGNTVSETRPDAPFTEFSNDKAVCNLAIPYGGMMFWEAGDYEFRVLVNNELVHSAFLHLMQVDG